MRYLVTGVAGFIGFYTARLLLERGDEVVGVDDLNAYYDVALKRARLSLLEGCAGFRFEQENIANRDAMTEMFSRERFNRVIHLAAQAGVRYSITNPFAYIDSNLVGFASILEGCRHTGVQHLTYASSSSVYGSNSRTPFSVHDGADHPVSLYAATKRANELMAHTYSHLYRLPTTGLRFFTVYGPWGRPDMAYFSFTRAILAGEPIEVFNNGAMERDFTYIDDIVNGVVRCSDRVPSGDPAWDSERPDPATSGAPYRIYNIGNHRAERLTRLIEVLEELLGKSAVRIMRPMQPGDVVATFADVNDIHRDVGFSPSTPLEAGLERFVSWYRDFYRA